jgi:hypothetical protein
MFGLLELLYVVVYRTGEEMASSNVNIRKPWSQKCPMSNEAEKSGFVGLFHLDAWVVPILPLLHISRHGVLRCQDRQGMWTRSHGCMAWCKSN